MTSIASDPFILHNSRGGQAVVFFPPEAARMTLALCNAQAEIVRLNAQLDLACDQLRERTEELVKMKREI